jgi:ADP-ribose pyrophosphatase YjhB (NUDIX family)
MYILFLQIANYVRNRIWKLFKSITLGVRVIAIQDNKILLVRHTYKNKNYWYLPGGGIKSGETLVEAANRELYEESGARVINIKLIGLYTDFSEGRSDHIALYTGVINNIDNVKSHEISETKFFFLDDLPEKIDPLCKREIQEFFINNYPVTAV